MALVLEAAADRKAEEPVALDLRGLASFTDGFVIVTGGQSRQTQAICDAILERLEAEGEPAGHVEGYKRGDWILLDLADVVVHVFTPETRRFYGLERLWGDAPVFDPSRPAPRRRPARETAREATARRPARSGRDATRSPATRARTTTRKG
jgi:ribosome-associated protein